MVRVNGSMAGPLGQSPKGQKGGLRGPGAGRLLPLSYDQEDAGPECKDGSATGQRTCTVEFEAQLSEDAGAMFLVHVIKMTNSLGAGCKKSSAFGKFCPCKRKEHTLVESQSAGKYLKGKENYILAYTGCGCWRTTEGTIYLISSKSPLFDAIKRAATQNIVSVPLKGFKYIRRQDAPKYGLEPIAIVTGLWDAAILSPDEVATLEGDLEKAAMDTLRHGCFAAWNCCEEQIKDREQGKKPNVKPLSPPGSIAIPQRPQFIDDPLLPTVVDAIPRSISLSDLVDRPGHGVRS